MFTRITVVTAFAVGSFFGMPSTSYAGPGSGGGGKGVVINGKPYLLDLVEGGVEQSPYFDSQTSAAPEFLGPVKEVFKDMSEVPVELIARKLTEISKVQYIFGLLMLKTMQQYQWKFVNAPPSLLNDHRQAIDGDKVQLAKRLNKSIIVYKKLATQMTPENLAALIFHETNYAYARPKPTGSGFLNQDIGAIQEFTAFLFTEPYRDKTVHYGKFISMIEGIYPENLLSLGSGGIVGDGDRFWFIWVNPELQLKIARDRLDMEGKAIGSLIGIGMFSSKKGDDQVGRDRSIVAYATENLCGALRKNKAYKAVNFEIKKPFRKFQIDTYEFAPNESRSYIRVVPADGNEHGFPVEIGGRSCESAVEEMVLGAADRATLGFHRNY